LCCANAIQNFLRDARGQDLRRGDPHPRTDSRPPPPTPLCPTPTFPNTQHPSTSTRLTFGARTWCPLSRRRSDCRSGAGAGRCECSSVGGEARTARGSAGGQGVGGRAQGKLAVQTVGPRQTCAQSSERNLNPHMCHVTAAEGTLAHVPSHYFHSVNRDTTY
jgi:hypothetical protein